MPVVPGVLCAARGHHKVVVTFSGGSSSTARYGAFVSTAQQEAARTRCSGQGKSVGVPSSRVSTCSAGRGASRSKA